MHRLSFAGNCDQDSFERACSKQDFWYHSYYFDNGFEVIGDYNIGQDILDYGFPPDMEGMKVLDIGTGGGWFAHYFHQRGADVTTVDARGYCDFDVRGRYDYPPVESEKPEPDRLGPNGEPVYFSPVSGGFWVMKDLLDADIRFVNSRAGEVAKHLAGETFDLVFIGALLLHVRDPVGVLMSARALCGDRLMATTPIIEGDESTQPMMALYTEVDLVSWWQPNRSCYRYWFLEAGFESVDVSKSVTLTADKSVESPHWEGPRNPTQLLCLANARV